MTQQPIKRVLCQGYSPNMQCMKCARQKDDPKPVTAFSPPTFVNGRCPMRVQK